jgi:alpha-glucosidase
MVLPVCKHYIELRYRLLQLFYDAMFKNTIDGVPICRALFINDPHDMALYNDKKCFIDDEFFVGKDLLIAPVLVPQSKDVNNGKRDVYLPAGSDWYCFTNNTMPLGSAVEGGTTVRDFDANLNLNGTHINFIVPIYVRAGAIIPTIELEQYVGQLNQSGRPNPITLNIYPGKGGEYTMYLDDGVSRSSAPQGDPDRGADEQARSEYRETKIEHAYTGKTRKISVNRIHDGYTPELEKYFFVAILHDPLETKTAGGCVKSVNIAGDKVELITGGTAAQRSNTLNLRSSNGWYYNENINTSVIKVFDDSPSIAITAEYF